MTATNPSKAGRREWLGLAVLMLPTILIVMDLTVLHLAVPHLTTDLQPTSTQLLWIVDIYGFMIAGSLITMGTLGDRIGRRKLLMIGGAAFGAASIVAAFSTSAGMLIAARALLGIAGATLMPSTMSLIRNMFLNPQQRTVAIGVWVSGFSLGSAIGPLVGGLLLEHFWWGSVFLLAVPVMALLLILAPIILPEFKDPNPGRFDLLSAGMSLSAVLLVIYGLKQVAQSEINAVAIGTIIFGLVIGALFIRRQTQLENPLIDLRLFRIRAFSASLVTYTLGVFVAIGSSLFVAQYLQLVLSLSPLHAGLWSIPGAIAAIIGSNLAPVFARRLRPAQVIAGGLLLATVGLGLFTQLGANSLAIIVVGNLLMAFGFNLTFTLTADLVVGNAPPERAGAASAISETGAEFGGALGIAILGSIGMAIYRAQVASGLPSSIPDAARHAAEETLGGALAAAEKLPAELSTALIGTAHGAFVHGLQVVALIGAVIFACLAVIDLLLLSHIEIHEHEADDEPTLEPMPQRPAESSAGD